MSRKLKAEAKARRAERVIWAAGHAGLPAVSVAFHKRLTDGRQKLLDVQTVEIDLPSNMPMIYQSELNARACLMGVLLDVSLVCTRRTTGTANINILLAERAV